MKKLSMMFVASLLIFFIPFSVNAEQKTFDDLFEEWEMNGYPANVGHVYEEKGEIVIGLVNPTEADKKAIRSQISDSEKVKFETATYSYNELLSISDDIWDEMDAQKTEEIYMTAIGWEEDKNGKPIKSTDGSKEFRVFVGVADDVLEKYEKKYAELYGEKVIVEVGEPGEEEIATDDDNNNLMVYLFLFIIFLVGLFFIYRERKNVVVSKQTVDGELITDKRLLSRKETISAIKESAITPSENVYRSIKKKITDK